MIINFSARFMSAFGRMAANVSHSLDGKGFAEVVQSELQGMKVYSLENNSYFDEVKLFNGKEEYLFAYRSLAEEYAGVFATPPMISLNRAKKIIITPIDNSNDIEVVERYTTQPWDIELRGLIIDMENHTFPIRKMKQLNGIFEKNNSWNVASEILQAV